MSKAPQSVVPRRANMQRWAPAEHAIDAAVRAVEAAGADVRLTDAVNLLQAARVSVADFVDGTTPITRRFVDERAERVIEPGCASPRRDAEGEQPRLGA